MFARSEAHPVFTIGYERREPEGFGELLASQGVRELVDVRDHPRSDKAGFSKSEMAWWLAELDPAIRYYHFQRFGVAKRTRDRYRSGAMTRDEFVANYERQLDRLPDDIVRLASVASAAPTALLCVEHDAGCCHRSVLAARIAAEADVYEVRHL